MIALTCLKECVVMYKFNVPGIVLELEISKEFNRIYARFEDGKICKIQMPKENNDASFKIREDNIDSNL